MRCRSRVLLFAIAALACAPGLTAQRYNFKFYGEDEGLHNQVVQVVLQDHAGFLWAGTQNGLFRYDGNHFTSFTKAEGLPGARIESLHESSDGTLFVGTHSGLARRVGNRFESIPLGVAKSVLGREGIASDRKGFLYIATERGLAMGTPTNTGWKFQLIPPPPGHPAEEPEESVYVDSSGIVWTGCGLEALCKLADYGGGNRRLDDTIGDGLPIGPWEAIIEDLHHDIWVRSEHQLAVHSSVTHRFELRAGVPPSTNTYPTLALDPQGRLLVPTNQGLTRETDDGLEIVGAENGLTTNDISAVEHDREGSIWLGLLGSGLARWLGYNEWQSWNDHDGLTRESVWSFVRDTSGRLWVGTQGGLNYAEEKGGRVSWHQQPVPGLEMTRALAAGTDGTLWIAGGYRGGLRQWNPKTSKARSFDAAQGLGNDSVVHVAVDGEGTVWAATNQGLFRSTGKDRFEEVQPIGTRPDEGFSMVAPDRHGRIWASGDLGLARYAGGQWSRYTTRDGLKDNTVWQVVEDPDGSIWIGYHDADGLTHLSFPDGANAKPKVEHFTTANGLQSDKLLFLGFDTTGRLWVGTDRGADVHGAYVHGTDVQGTTGWRHYGRADGLIWDDCNGNAFLADAGGVWIGTSRGLSRFRPSAAAISGVPPTVVFTSVKIGGKEVDPTGPLEVPYGQNTLQVQFAALTFIQESAVMFRYRLTNGAGSWLETPQRELTYPTLAPGQYTLEVTARNAQGTWSAEPARLNFQVMTPWWLSWWFRFASVMLALFLGRKMWQRRTYRLEAERQRLEAAVTERTRELFLEKQRVVEEKARTEQENAIVQQQKQEIERLLDTARQASKFKSEFLANMSHEIRTPMNGILGMTDMVLATEVTDEQREYLETARLSAGSLLALLNDVLDFSKVEAGKLDLNPIPFSLPLCVHQTLKIFSVAAGEKRLVLGIEIGDEVPNRLVGDPDRLQQVLINLIGNAIKFTSQGGVRLRLNCEKPAEDGAVMVQFSVHDTGIGIPANKTELIFEAFRQADGSTTRQFGGTGLGLAICSKLVDLMGGRIWVESELGVGSVFHFTARFTVATEPEAAAPANPVSLRSLLGATNGADGEKATPSRAGRAATVLEILLAEDNPVNQQLERRLLERRGHRVTIANNGREALERLENGRFDVILMDVQMPDMDGLEATAAIRLKERGTGAHIPIIALTARTMQEDRDRCTAAGMDAFITKPIKAVEFLQIVEAVAAGVEDPAATGS